MNISSKMKELREENGWTQRDLASHANLTPQCISLIEKGEREPGINTALLIANAFSVPLDYLVGNSEKAKYYTDDFSISKKEQDLILAFRKLSEGMQRNIIEMVTSLSGGSVGNIKRYS